MTNLKINPSLGCSSLVKVSLLNSTIFFSLSLLGDYYDFQSVAYLVAILAIFSATSFAIFITAARSQLFLVPIFWFILGAGIFFGLGTIPHLYGVFDQSSQSWYGGYKYSDVIKACWINGLSCLLVSLFSTPLFQNIKNNFASDSLKNISLRLFNLMFYFSLCIFILKLTFFPYPDNLLIRGFLDKGIYLVLSTLLMGGIVFSRASLFQRLCITFFIISMLFYGVLGASKYDAMIPLISFLCGYIFESRGRSRLIILTLIITTVFFFTSSIINTMRGNCNYDSVGNLLVDRALILKDSIRTIILRDTSCSDIEKNTTKNPNFSVKSYIDENANFNISEDKNQFSKILRRISTTSIATFLINQHDTGQNGNTLENAYVYFIPRIIWSEKPVVTGAGQALGSLYYPGNPINSLGPTFSAELYWNYGLLGVIIGSALIGILIGLLSRWSILFINGDFYGYILIAIPAIVYAFWVESWIGSTYVGGFISILQMLLAYFLASSIIKYFFK
jgi:hypothetical protein